MTADNGVGSAPPTREYSGTVVQAPVWNPGPDLVLEVGVGAQAAFSAIGSPSPVYAVSAGALPTGLALDSTTGVVTGTPTVPGPYSFTLSASNGVGDPVTLEVTGIVVTAPTWWDIAIASPRVGAPFSDAVAAYGTPAPGYAVTAGRLPGGLAIDALTGAITGTPTEPGSFAFTVTAANGVGAPAAQAFTIVVEQPPVVTSTQRPPALVAGTPLSIDLGAGVAASPAPTYRLTAGELPAGVTLDEATGRLSGTPTTPGDYYFAITVDNGTGEPLVLEFSGTVASQVADGAGAAGSQPPKLAATGVDGVPSTLVAALLLILGGLVLSSSARPRRRRAI